jgi:hypothetical protein
MGPVPLLTLFADTVALVTSDEAREARLSTGDVADLLGIDRRTVLRIPKDQLDYWLTPGGGLRQHRRYRRVDVSHYAREHLGREIDIA